MVASRYLCWRWKNTISVQFHPPGEPRKVPYFKGNWIAGFGGKVGWKLKATAVFQANRILHSRPAKLEKNIKVDREVANMQFCMFEFIWCVARLVCSFMIFKYALSGGYVNSLEGIWNNKFSFFRFGLTYKQPVKLGISGSPNQLRLQDPKNQPENTSPGVLSRPFYIIVFWKFDQYFSVGIHFINASRVDDPLNGRLELPATQISNISTSARPKLGHCMSP